jgi:leucyl-tRNA synthetase
VGFNEPFTKLFNQGMITRDGEKMSKSEGHTVSPDDIVRKYGCDALRMYELFIGPPAQDSDWDDSGIDGVFRFLNRLWRLMTANVSQPAPDNAEWTKLRHRFIRDITHRIEALQTNTVVSGFMETLNALTDMVKKHNGLEAQTADTFAVLLAPFAPHTAEALWAMRGHPETVFKQPWPDYEEQHTKDDTVEYALQINGKLRGQMTAAADITKEAALTEAKIVLAKWLDGAEIVKEVFVPGRIVNIVVKG